MKLYPTLVCLLKIRMSCNLRAIYGRRIPTRSHRSQLRGYHLISVRTEANRKLWWTLRNTWVLSWERPWFPWSDLLGPAARVQLERSSVISIHECGEWFQNVGRPEPSEKVYFPTPQCPLLAFDIVPRERVADRFIRAPGSPWKFGWWSMIPHHLPWPCVHVLILLINDKLGEICVCFYNTC